MRSKPFSSIYASVSVIGLGGMPLSLESRPSSADAQRVIHTALDAGMTLIDTADVYCIDDSDIGHNEQLMAQALTSWRGPRDQVLIATKGGLRRPGGAWTTDASPAHLREACEHSLRALGVECIALYQLHAPDDEVPFADSVGALADLRRAGKIEHIGLSNVSLSQVKQAQAIVPIVSIQNRCNPYDLRAFTQGIVSHCEQHSLAFLPYSPVGGSRDRNKLAQDPSLNQVARAHRATAFEVALAWLLAQSQTMFPIPGASRVASAESSARAADIELSVSEIQSLNKAFGL